MHITLLGLQRHVLLAYTFNNFADVLTDVLHFSGKSPGRHFHLFVTWLIGNIQVRDASQSAVTLLVTNKSHCGGSMVSELFCNVIYFALLFLCFFFNVSVSLSCILYFLYSLSVLQYIRNYFHVPFCNIEILFKKRFRNF